MLSEMELRELRLQSDGKRDDEPITISAGIIRQLLIDSPSSSAKKSVSDALSAVRDAKFTLDDAEGALARLQYP